MRKLYLCARFVAILLLGLFLLSPFISHAVAASNYGMKTTTSLKLRGDAPAGNCSTEEEWGVRWAEFMSADTSNPNSYRNTWNYTSNYDNARVQMDIAHDAFAANFAAGSGWAVSHQAPGYRGGGQAITIYVFDPSSTFHVIQGGLKMTSGEGINFMTFAYNPNVGCRWQALDYGGVKEFFLPVNANSPLFFIASDNITYPEDYSVTRLPSSPPPARNYVALGDSFSSGEGNTPFESGTENRCHRSSSAYPRLLTSRLYINLTGFVACAGATTLTVMNEQAAALSKKTDIVTLTVGGNDVGFKDFAAACTAGRCDFSTQAYKDIRKSILNDLPAKLASTYKAIDNKTSRKTRIYVLGYPHLAPPKMPTGANSLCFPLNGGNNDPDPTKNNGATIYAIQTQLNNAIQRAVSNYGSSKFYYVNPNASSSPFNGHDWCSQDRYFNIFTINSVDYSYHPNVAGHAAYATVVTPYLKKK